ncbi:Piso0_002339 [Millerozyma farinosa CBS 7064]|uniref:Piso0_002339 protein n=1 Tax=Pichia sorbitophila (strain ATCC MYA-4447 / BCRC 22081 / CBS 7064 / NBRC 10061 / NRRL Y-12695) TaxID=559304 RepID=G8YCC6_PICSO|nr:Piso0_002339 [Millerozyma farinosa CBS 7064]
MSRSRSGSRSRSRSRSGTGRYRMNLTGAKRARPSTINSIIGFLFSGGYQRHKIFHRDNIFSLYRLLKLELNLPSNDNKEPPDSKVSEQFQSSYEQICNMAEIPLLLEKYMVFGLLVCLNSLLTILTLVPLKLSVIFYQIGHEICTKKIYKERIDWNSTAKRLQWIKRDIITISISILALGILSMSRMDISRMYHDIRGQEDIKLYVTFGVLEVADKLCSSLGQDLMNILHQLPVLPVSSSSIIKFTTFFLLSVLYLAFHAYILIYQTVSLNVAANSYSNALLTLLLSNQFAELKGSVFKKFDREGLFQISMADLAERFQLSLMLGSIALRNLLQVNTIHSGVIPNSWKSLNNWFGAIYGPSTVVLGSEILVDWLKHCYITKFNKVRPRVYNNFLNVLSLDFLEVFKAVSDGDIESDTYELTDYILLTRRIGLPLLASIVCCIRIASTDFRQILLPSTSNSFLFSCVVNSTLICLSFSFLVFVRLILSLILVKWALRIKNQQQEYQEMLRQTELDKTIDLDNVLSSLDAKLSEEASNDNTDGRPLKLDFDSEISNIANTTSSSPLVDKRRYLKELDVNRASETPSPDSQSSPINFTFLPGSPNTHTSSINPSTRNYLFNVGEDIPPTPEEKRNRQMTDRRSNALQDKEEGLGEVNRYEMSSKRIW